MVGHAVSEATGRKEKTKKSKKDVSGEDVVVMGSGNLGLVYLMEEKRRLTMEEIDERHPKLLPALREHPHVGLGAGSLVRARCGRARRRGCPLPGRGAGRGRRPARALLAGGPRPPRAHRRLPARRRPDDRQLLRPRPGRGLRVRGADLVPRRPRRHPDAPVPALPGSTCPSRSSRSSAQRRSTPSSRGGATTCRATAPCRFPRRRGRASPTRARSPTGNGAPPEPPTAAGDIRARPGGTRLVTLCHKGVRHPGQRRAGTPTCCDPW